MVNKKRTPESVYTDGMAAGKGSKASLAAAKAVAPEGKFSHSRADRAWYADPRNPKGIKPGSLPCPATDDARSKAVVKYRAAGMSWGFIAIGMGHGLTERACENLFDKAGVAAQGTRTGKGGRFVADDGRLYAGNHKGAGVEAADRKALRALREDPAALKAYLAKADQYESVLPTLLKGKAKAAKKATK